MKVFVAGATGAIGRRLVPLLVGDGHEVVASTRRRAGVPAAARSARRPVVADGLDRDAVFEAVVARRAGGRRPRDDGARPA